MRELELETDAPLSVVLDEDQARNSYLALKDFLDVIIAIIILVVCSPVMLLIAIAIKRDSPGPVLYRQLRIGRGGEPYYMLKFRSMRIDSDPALHREHVQRLIRENTTPGAIGAKSLKIKDDPRVTRVGKTIRALSLDELPQFFNVLRGEMSIVGPRPSMPYEYELYTDRHKLRLQVLPGITGLWQVTARNQVSFEEMVELDISYIESMSLRLDLSIMLRTPMEMLRGKGGG